MNPKIASTEEVEVTWLHLKSSSSVLPIAGSVVARRGNFLLIPRKIAHPVPPTLQIEIGRAREKIGEEKTAAAAPGIQRSAADSHRHPLLRRFAPSNRATILC
jgi:hypothetical protein